MKWIIPVVGLLLGYAAGAVLHNLGFVHAQSRPAERGNYPETRVWRIHPADWAPILVVDTAGVCLYETYHGSMTAIPKTQLPPGTGCQ